MRQNLVSRRRRERIAIVGLTALFGGGIFFFLLLIGGWLLPILLVAVAALTVLFSLHYVLWGRMRERDAVLQRRPRHVPAQREPEVTAAERSPRRNGTPPRTDS